MRMNARAAFPTAFRLVGAAGRLTRSIKRLDATAVHAIVRTVSWLILALSFAWIATHGISVNVFAPYGLQEYVH